MLKKQLRKIANKIPNPLQMERGRRAKTSKGKRELVVEDRLQEIFSVKGVNKSVGHLRKIANRSHKRSAPTLNALIDFSLHLHGLKQVWNEDLQFIRMHLNGHSEGPIGDFVRAIDGQTKDITVVFDADKSLMDGITITTGDETVELGQLFSQVTGKTKVKKHRLDLVDGIRGYMLRTVTLMDQMKKKNY